MEQVTWPTTTWLDNVTSVESTANITTYETWPYWHLPCQCQTAVVYHGSIPRPIRLTMTEVEHLRMHAAGNPKLKEILQKFIAQIEIIVEL